MNDKPITNPMLDLSYIRDDDVDFFGIDLADEKSFRLFIKLTEGLCRRTIEYQLWAKRTKMLAHEQNEDSDTLYGHRERRCLLVIKMKIQIKTIPRFVQFVV